MAKTALEDVAREAGCARATVYRYFGGKQQLLVAALVTSACGSSARSTPPSCRHWPLEDALVAMGITATELLEHAALQFVLAHEPELLLPVVTFDGGDRFLASPEPLSRRRSPASSLRPRPTARRSGHAGLPRVPRADGAPSP